MATAASTSTAIDLTEDEDLNHHKSPHANQISATSSAAAASANHPPPANSTPVAPVPVASIPLHDRLSGTFSGDTLVQLEQLGVSAFDSLEVEQNVLAEAIATDQQQQQEKEARLQAAIAASAKDSQPASTTAPVRQRIPKKSAARLEKEAERASFIPLPDAYTRRPSAPIVHPTERPPPSVKKSRFSSGSTKKYGGIGGGKTSASSSSARTGNEDSLFDRAAASAEQTMKDGEEKYRERQRQIETGEMTPFAQSGGEKTFTRIQTKRIGSIPSTTANSSSSTVASAASSSITSRATPGLGSPFPSALQNRPTIPRKPSTAKSPSLVKKSSLNAVSKSRPTPTKRRRPITSDEEEDESEEESTLTKKVKREPMDEDVEMPHTKRRVSVKKEYQPWSCPTCTYLNPTDFVSRCEMCHVVRPREAATAAAAAISSSSSTPTVKLEPGLDSSPLKSKYIELSSDEEMKDVSSSPPPSATERRTSNKKKRKRSVKNEDDEAEYGVDDIEEEDDESSDSDGDVDEDDDDVVDSALKREDELLDVEDGEEDLDLDEDLVMDDIASSRHSRRSKLMHDDYEDWRYEDRVEAFRQHQAKQERIQARQLESAAAGGSAPDPTSNLDVAFDGGYILPAYIWNKLFAYQKTCIKWLWELHAQHVGGIIADEMGLGKTVQMIAFLAGMHYSAQHHAVSSGGASSSAAATQFRSLGPTLIIVPATIMSQWLREFHEWYPELRICVLHDSIPHDSNVTRRDIVNKIFEKGGVIITTYQSFRATKHLLLPREWGYVVLDEGHKIRNPDAAITLLVKQVLSIHRIILTGSPIQNSLTELWSLFDFIFPGKLGTLPIFEDEFCFPILNGGYTSATPVQIQLAYKCALILRDLINPYILRRSKADVAQHLPPKTEQVLFCNLTSEQYDIYRRFLDTHAKDISEIMEGKLSLFRMIHYLRKIANHPDLLDLKIKGAKSGSGAKRSLKDEHNSDDDEMGASLSTHGADYGSVDRSGKMKVVQQVLKMWKDQGHRCLLFSQTRQMLDILEKFIRKEGYNYRRIDGATNIKSRLPLIDEFNDNDDIFIMLLTTRAGGLGVNLTGADRVILYDPDWNPMTDSQARERAYRIGQQRSVTCYRLITRGCIEEKVYHRQIWKQFLTDKVLRDPKQKRFFSNHDIKDLFSLTPLPSMQKKSSQVTNETANIFKGSGGEIDKRDVIQQERERKQQEEFKQSSPPPPAVVQPPPPPPELEEGEIPEEPPHPISNEPIEEKESSPPARKRLKSLHQSESDIQVKTEPSPEPKLEIADYHSDSEKDDRQQHQSSTADDNRILAALFSRDGIQSAMDHDAILGASSQQEKAVIANLAQKVANRAIAALKKSRQAMKDAPVNAPTWTGRSGVSGAPDSAPRPRFGATTRRPGGMPISNVAATVATNEALAEARLRPASFDSSTAAAAASSSEKLFDSSVSGFSSSGGAASGRIGGAVGSSTLLARMRSRSHVSSVMASHTGLPDATLMSLDGAGEDGRSALPSAQHTADKSAQLAQSLRETLAQHPDGMTSSELISLFAPQIGTLESDKLIFRQLLRSVAVLMGKRKGSDKKWMLKQEFE